jgi:hypothetical protein
VSGPERDSSESTWEVLPPPPVIPLTQVDPYQPPATDSMDPRSLRLVALRWVAWAIGTSIIGSLVVLAGLSSTSPWNVASGWVFGLPCLLLSGWAWYHLLFAPRLTLDEEGFRVTTYGLRRDELSLRWNEIEHLRLHSRRTRLGDELHLSVTVPLDGTHAGSRRERRGLDLALGMASFGRVDRAFHRYCPRRYSSSHY